MYSCLAIDDEIHGRSIMLSCSMDVRRDLFSKNVKVIAVNNG